MNNYIKKQLKNILITSIPGDKSISHRALILASAAQGISRIKGVSLCKDCLSTLGCLRAIGAEIKLEKDEAVITGKGLSLLSEPEKTLNCQNSGTTARLLSGILSASGFNCILTGDASLKARPMKRIIEPLILMGAKINSPDGAHLPLYIKGRPLKGIDYFSKIASAQVKSAILFAGIYAEGKTTVSEPRLSRNHSEIMLKGFGVDIRTGRLGSAYFASVSGCNRLYAQAMTVPGDISSAAYFMAAALIMPGLHLIIKNVGINPTRDGVIRVFREMGAKINLLEVHNLDTEPYADIEIKSSKLHGIRIEGEIIPSLIDEIPIICAVACFAEGKTVIREASELKVKESDRIKVMCSELAKLGADITEVEDGMIIKGEKKLHAAEIDSYNDHRIAMTFAVLNLALDGKIKIKGRECVDVSYPEFYTDIKKIFLK